MRRIRSDRPVEGVQPHWLVGACVFGWVQL